MATAGSSVYSVQECAERLGVTPGRVRQLIMAGELASILKSGARWVTVRDLDRFITQRSSTPTQED